MKQEVYSCLKMLESLKTEITIADKNDNINLAKDLGEKYRKIYGLLKEHLGEKRLKFIPYTAVRTLYGISDNREYIRELLATCNITIAYLYSLDMDLDKELKEKEDKLKFREKEIEYMQKLLNKSLDAIKQFPELQRSKIVEDIKKTHRSIEKHSKNKGEDND